EYWLRPFPARAVVAVDPDGTILGTAESGPNKGGPGAHIASAGVMVDPAHGGRGVGRALAEHVLAAARAVCYLRPRFHAAAARDPPRGLAGRPRGPRRPPAPPPRAGPPPPPGPGRGAPSFPAVLARPRRPPPDPPRRASPLLALEGEVYGARGAGPQSRGRRV